MVRARWSFQRFKIQIPTSFNTYMGLLVCSQCGSFLTVHPFIQPFCDLLSWYNNCVNWLLEAIWDFNRFSALGVGILLPLYFHHPCPLSPQGQVHSFPLLAHFVNQLKASGIESTHLWFATTLAATAMLVWKKKFIRKLFLKTNLSFTISRQIYFFVMLKLCY